MDLYRLDFNPPRIVLVHHPDLMATMVTEDPYHPFFTYETYPYESIVHRRIPHEWRDSSPRSAYFYYGDIYVTKNGAKSILDKQWWPDSRDVDDIVCRYTNILDAVLCLSQAMCLDLVVRVVGFL